MRFEAVQTGGTAKIWKERHEKSAEIYLRRKDILGIKARLLDLVPAEEYWLTLRKFIHGECNKVKYDEAISTHLTTNEMRILHNQLIRAIIFNAHFSTLPPPGVVIPSHVIPEHMKSRAWSSQKMKSMETFSSVEMGHLPSLEQLSSRIAILLKSSKVKVDNSALSQLLLELKKYIVLVLKKTVDLSTKDCLTPSNMNISASHITHVIRNFSSLGNTISHNVLAKMPM